MKQKKGALFSTDALFALVVILLALLIIYPTIKYAKHDSEIQGDLIASLSALKIGEIDSVYVQSLIASGDIKDLNKSVLEQIGEFYAVDSPYAAELASDVLSNIEVNENIGIWYGSELLASDNSSAIEDAKNIEVERQVISGIQKGSLSEGYSARAFLSKSFTEEYFEFGGYVGDGNLSVGLDYDGTIESVDLEIAINDEFDIYINDIYSGHYAASPSQFTPATYDLSAYLANFNSGFNIVEFRGDNLFIAGGFMKISYESSAAYEQDSRYYFPGVGGIVNLYDGFYVPGNLNALEIYLHYISNQSLFLTLGNVTVFNQSSSVETTYTLTDAVLDGFLDYDSLDKRTTPLRMGLSESNFTSGFGTGVADIIFIIDSTGSMGSEIVDVYNIADDFVTALENSSVDYRLGLVEFKDYPSSPCGSGSDFPYLIHTFLGQEFTTNPNDFRSTVNLITAAGGNDLPESHLRAINESVDMDWRSNAQRFEILLTDAEPHALDCLEEDWNYWYCEACLGSSPPWYCGWFDIGDCQFSGVDNDENCNLGPKYVQDVIDRLVDEEITFYYINKDNGLCGNRIVADNMTNLTGGAYYEYTESGGVENIILDIAEEIASVTYFNQTAVGVGVETILYPDSYIEFDYTQLNYSYGLIVTAETENFDANGGTLTIEQGVDVAEAFVVSYSGPRWTYKVEVNGVEVYNLGDYGDEFVALGDPYSIYIAPSFISEGNNSVNVTTAVSENDLYGGSNSDKVIYTVVKPAIAYSEILATAEGCAWEIRTEDNETINVNVPVNYSGSDDCYYVPGNCDSSSYRENDAIASAVFSLLGDLDFDGDCEVDVSFTSQDLQIDSNEITGIPFTWDTEVQVRIWY